MATSAFKSTTKRAPIGSSGSDDSGNSSNRSLRRSRSLSRFSLPEPAESEPDYIKNGPKGKFVNTKRGSSTTPFPEISLDDLAIEFFSPLTSKNDNESDGGAAREGRSVGRWASDTASSRRRGRSVSRAAREGFVPSGGGGSTTAAKNVNSSRRRRSLSVARYQISDSENEVDLSRGSSNRANVKAPISVNKQMPATPNATTSSHRRIGRSRSHTDLSLLHDGYSSHSSVLTDDDTKDTHFRKNGFEKIIRAVYAQKKADHPTEDVTNGGLYEAMRKELRYAVEEIRNEFNQAMVRKQTNSDDCMRSEDIEAFRDLHMIKGNYATKSEQLEKHKQDLLTEMLLKEQHGPEVSKMVKKLPDSRTSAVAEKQSRPRKRSSDRNRVSKRLTEEAERYFEDFISSIEDTDISSFDGERSDGSSTLGGSVKARDGATRDAETYKTPVRPPSHPVEMDGVVLPWLQWETSHDGSVSGKSNAHIPATPKALQWDSEKEMVSLYDPSCDSVSSHGSSWSPSLFNSPSKVKSEDTCKSNNGGVSCFDMDEYLKLKNGEELLCEMYRERNRISSGGLLLCTGALS